MNLQITGHHVEVSAALKAYAVEKLKRLERHFDHLISATVVLSVDKERQTAEATLNASGTKVHAAATDKDLYAAIDLMIDKLDQQVRKYKEKIRDHHAKEVSHHQAL